MTAPHLYLISSSVAESCVIEWEEKHATQKQNGDAKIIQQEIDEAGE